MWPTSFPKSALALFLLFVSIVNALQVTEDSGCEALCTDTSSDSDTPTTNSTDIVCEDDNFTKTGKGIKFKNCLDCLQSSNTTKGDDSDVFSYLYNVRYAFDVCIFSYPKAATGGTINSPCNIDGACAPLSKALKISLVNNTNDNQYDYCEAGNKAIEGDSYQSCMTCLQSTASQTYFSNFLVALKAGCEQRPEAGDLIGLSGSIFSSSVVNITDPNANTTLPGDGGAPVGAMTTGTIVGIVVGCALGFISALGLLFIYCRKNRRQGMKIDSPPPETPMNHHYGMGGIRKGPIFPSHSQRSSSYNSKGGSSSSNNAAALPNGKPITNTQYYGKLELERQAALNYFFVPQTGSRGPQSGIPAHAAYIPQVASRTVEIKPKPKPVVTEQQQHRSNIPDSYALQTYLAAVEESRGDPNIATSHPEGINTTAVKSTREEYIPPPPPMPPPPPAPAPASKVPSLTLPSLAKFKMPKKYTPPTVFGSHETSPERTPQHTEERRIEISQPMTVLGARFEDRPLAGGQVLATEAPKTLGRYLSSRSKKSPLMTSTTDKSGTSINTKNLW